MKNTIIQRANFSKLNFAIKDLTVISSGKKAYILKSPSPPPRSVLAVHLHWKNKLQRGNDCLTCTSIT